MNKDKIIREQARMIEQLEATIAVLQEEIAELKEKLNKNSNNSAKPPSSDGLSKAKPRSLRTSSGKKPGAQKGHEGKGLTLIGEIQSAIVHSPQQCENCKFCGQCISCGKSAVRNVIDVTIKAEVTPHYTEAFACPLQEGKVITGEFPEEIHSSIQYGNGIRALAIALNTAGMMSIHRTHEILQAVLGVPVSTGTISDMVEQFSDKIADTVQEIAAELQKQPVVNCDETGIRVEGKNYWVHSACNADFTCLSLQEKRGYAGMEAAGFLPQYIGTIVHDCWKPYWSVQSVRHGLCCAHLLRELNGVMENAPAQAFWANDMKALLLEMNTARNEASTQGVTEFPSDVLRSYECRYDAIINSAYAANPLPSRKPGQRGRIKRGKWLALVDRLAEHKGEVCLFAHDFSVPFTNNMAEQSIRMMKVKTKVSGCFRTEDGANHFTIIMSYLHTAMKRHINAFMAILSGLSGNSRQILLEG